MYAHAYVNAHVHVHMINIYSMKAKNINKHLDKLISSSSGVHSHVLFHSITELTVFQ